MQVRFATIGKVLATIAAGACFCAYIHFFAMKLGDSRIGLARDMVAAFLAVVALAGGVGLGVERIRARGDGRAWGVGRWTWSLSALSIALAGIRLAAERPWRNWDLEGRVFEGINRFLIESIGNSLGNLSCYLVAFVVVAGLAGAPRDAAPDFREWSGRGFGCLVVAWGVAYAMIAAS